MVWLQVLSNLSIGLAYVAISMTLGYIVYRIRDLPFQWAYVAFGIFIVTCGFTHFMDVWVIWTPVYWLDGSIRAVTAVASVGTAVLLFPLVPKAVALAGAARLAHARGVRLEQLNVELEALYEKTRETLAEAIPQLVWTTSPDGHPDFYNRRWSEYSGEAFEAGSSWERLVHPDDLARATSRWAESLRSGEVYELEVRLRGADGGPRAEDAAHPAAPGDRAAPLGGAGGARRSAHAAAAHREVLHPPAAGRPPGRARRRAARRHPHRGRQARAEPRGGGSRGAGAGGGRAAQARSGARGLRDRAARRAGGGGALGSAAARSGGHEPAHERDEVRPGQAHHGGGGRRRGRRGARAVDGERRRDRRRARGPGAHLRALRASSLRAGTRWRPRSTARKRSRSCRGGSSPA